MNSPADAGWALEGATADDFEALLALRISAMRQSLERLGRFDPLRARERLAQGFRPEHVQHIVVDGRRVGFVLVTPVAGGLRLNHLIVDPALQGRGIGSQVLQWVCAQADEARLPLTLNALKESDANRFYLRHGFVQTGQGEWDNEYLRTPRAVAEA